MKLYKFLKRLLSYKPLKKTFIAEQDQILVFWYLVKGVKHKNNSTDN